MHHRPDRAVLGFTLESNRAEGRVAEIDPHPEVQGISSFAPDGQQIVHPFPHGQCQPHRLSCRIIGRQGIVEVHRQAILDERSDCAFEPVDHATQAFVVRAQHRKHFLRRRHVGQL